MSVNVTVDGSTPSLSVSEFVTVKALATPELFAVSTRRKLFAEAWITDAVTPMPSFALMASASCWSVAGWVTATTWPLMVIEPPVATAVVLASGAELADAITCACASSLTMMS